MFKKLKICCGCSSKETVIVPEKPAPVSFEPSEHSSASDMVENPGYVNETFINEVQPVDKSYGLNSDYIRFAIFTVRFVIFLFPWKWGLQRRWGEHGAISGGEISYGYIIWWEIRWREIPSIWLSDGEKFPPYDSQIVRKMVAIKSNGGKKINDN